MLLVAGAALWLGAGPATAAQLTVTSVFPPVAGAVTVVADVRPTLAEPVADAITVTAGDTTVPARATPMMSDRLAATVVLDSSAAGKATLQGALNGAAAFLMRAPAGARVAAVADTTPPKRLTTGRAAPKDALQALNTISPAGERSTAAAIMLALAQLPRPAAGQPRLVLLASNASDAGNLPAPVLAERLRRAGAVLAVVATNPDTSYWSRVTTDVGGTLISATPTTLADAFDTLADTLRARYLITFPTPQRVPVSVAIRANTTTGPVTTEAYLPAVNRDELGGERSRDAPWQRAVALGGGLTVLLAAASWLAARSRTRFAIPGLETSGISPGSPTTPELSATGGEHRAPAPAAPGSRLPPERRVEPRVAPPRPQAPVEPTPSRQRGAPTTTEPLPGADVTEADAPLYAYLNARVGNTAADVADQRTDQQHAVAQIALAAAGRPDLLDHVAEAERRIAGCRLSDWPPTALTLDLIAAARRVTTGDTVLVGPDSIRVQQTLTDGRDGTRRPVLRLTRNGDHIRDCPTAQELSRHVDLASLLADHRDR